VVTVDPLTPAAQTDLDKVAALYGIDVAGVGGDSGGDGGAAGDGAPLKRIDVTLTDSKGNTVTGKADAVASVDAGLKLAGIADTAKFDPVKSIYKYDGTGVDAVLESISHNRDGQTGATQLRAKLSAVQTDATGTVIPTLITASTPLATTSVAVSTIPGLTFSKLNAWVNEMNRCLALSSAARSADAICSGSTATLVSPGFKHNGRDFAENYRALYSESGRTAVQGSTLKNANNQHSRVQARRHTHQSGGGQLDRQWQPTKL
jgi:hypothetical protein